MRRNNLDIYADIIQVANGGAKKTKIVYSCNLNFKILNKYMEILIEKEFIKKTGKYYFSTPKGRAFLTQYKEFIAPLTKTAELASVWNKNNKLD